MSHVARVGVILVVAVGLLAAGYYMLSGGYARMNSYVISVVFDNALGLQQGSKVRMAGVDVGIVDDIGLDPDNRARLKLVIDRQYRIPEGSKFTIATGALIGEKYLEILPTTSSRHLESGTVIEGPEQVRKPFEVEEVGRQVQALLHDTQTMMQSLNQMVGNPALQTGVIRSVENLARTTARTEELIIGAQQIVLRNQSSVDKTMANLVLASAELRGAVSDVRATVSRPELQSNVIETSAAVRTAAERLDAAVQDVRDFTSDPDVSRNLKDTTQNLTEATANARDVTERVSRMFGSGVPRITVNLPRPKFQSGTRVWVEAAGAGSGRTRTDLMVTVPTGGTSGLRLGLYDFTEGNKLVAQRVSWIDPKTAMRYGIYGGHPGIGMDYEATPRLTWAGDLYNPKFPQLDLRGRYFYSSDFGLVFGVDGILRQPRAVVGIQWRQ